MLKEQRKKIIDYLVSDAPKISDKVRDNLLRQDDKHWFIKEDKLPINKEDGSCATINERLIDPLLFEWLVEALPDRDKTPTTPPMNKWKKVADELVAAKKIKNKKKGDTDLAEAVELAATQALAEADDKRGYLSGEVYPTLHNESRAFIIGDLYTYPKYDDKIKDRYRNDSYKDGVTLTIDAGEFLIKTYNFNGDIYTWDDEEKEPIPVITDSQVVAKVDHELLKMATDPQVLPHVTHPTVRLNTLAGVTAD